MTDQCSLCKGTKIDPDTGETCIWCDGIGTANGLSPSTADPITQHHRELKAFRLLPYGTKFRYQGTTDVWVRIGHNLIAEWPARVFDSAGEPRQSLCVFCHLDGDEDDNTLDTLVEVVD